MSNIFTELFTYPQWFIAYRKRMPVHNPFNTDHFQVITPPSGRFYADPFVIKYNHENYIFFEDYKFIKGKGVISFIKIDKDGSYTSPEVVLERNYHLSYPFIFEWENKVFMIPETSRNNSIELYSALNFPYDWKLERVIMNDVNAADATIWFSDDKVWMFTNIVSPGRAQHTDLYLFYAQTIFDKWQAHPQNPIVSDIASARPAGSVFKIKDHIIRPGQNSTSRYGQALVFNKINHLSEKEYSEVKLEQIEPNWYPNGVCCHTYNFNDDMEVIDGAIIKRDAMRPCRKLFSILYKVVNNVK